MGIEIRDADVADFAFCEEVFHCVPGLVVIVSWCSHVVGGLEGFGHLDVIDFVRALDAGYGPVH